MKKDGWFIANSILLGIVILFDLIMTAGGLNLGFKEGNPLIRWLILEIGIFWALLFVGLFSLLGIFCLLYLRTIMKTENQIRASYFGLSLIICWRAFIIGTWIGILHVKMGL